MAYGLLYHFGYFGLFGLTAHAIYRAGHSKFLGPHQGLRSLAQITTPKTVEIRDVLLRIESHIMAGNAVDVG